MIRLVTVIGHGVELLPHFISHYTKYVDEICIVSTKQSEERKGIVIVIYQGNAHTQVQ